MTTKTKTAWDGHPEAALKSTHTFNSNPTPVRVVNKREAR